MIVMENVTKVIAFCGKGGAGKTSLCALAIKYLTERKKRVLAIDADPAGGLSWALGITPARTLDDLRISLHNIINDKELRTGDELYELANYELLASLVEHTGFDFLAVGRPESEGCFCSINGFLRHCVGKLIEHYEYVCIDGEAGLEQVNRRVLETVTHLIIVSDTSRRSIDIAHNLLLLAQKRTQTMHCGIIINKLGDSNCETGQLPVLGMLPVSQTIALYDTRGKSLLQLSDSDEYYQKLKEVLIQFIQ